MLRALHSLGQLESILYGRAGSSTVVSAESGSSTSSGGNWDLYDSPAFPSSSSSSSPPRSLETRSPSSSQFEGGQGQGQARPGPVVSPYFSRTPRTPQAMSSDRSDIFDEMDRASDTRCQLRSTARSPNSPPLTPLLGTGRRRAQSTGKAANHIMEADHPPTPVSLPRSSVRIRNRQKDGLGPVGDGLDEGWKGKAKGKGKEVVVEIPMSASRRKHTLSRLDPLPEPEARSGGRRTNGLSDDLNPVGDGRSDTDAAPVARKKRKRQGDRAALATKKTKVNSLAGEGSGETAGAEVRTTSDRTDAKAKTKGKSDSSRAGRDGVPRRSLRTGKDENFLAKNEDGTTDVVGKIHLIQERLRYNPWKMLVATSLLNKTSGRAARPILEVLLERWPTPQHLAEASISDLSSLLYPLGLYNQRASSLIRFSRQYLDLRWPLYVHEAEKHPFHTSDLPPLPAPGDDLDSGSVLDVAPEDSMKLSPVPVVEGDHEGQIITRNRVDKGGKDKAKCDGKQSKSKNKLKGNTKDPRKGQHRHQHPGTELTNGATRAIALPLPLPLDVQIFHGSGVYASDSFRIFSHLLPGRGGPEAEARWLGKKARAVERLRMAARSGARLLSPSASASASVDGDGQCQCEGIENVTRFARLSDVEGDPHQVSGWDGSVEQLGEWLSEDEDEDEGEAGPGPAEEEWRKVRPNDKELRRYLIWRWGIEGIVYDIHTGPKIVRDRDRRRMGYLLSQPDD